MKFSEIKARTETVRGVKHTEGVWEAHGPVIIANGKRIAQTIYSDRPDEDAQLFAAAPEAVADRAELVRFVDEFAAAGHAMIRAYGNCGSPMQQQAADALQALIARTRI